MEGKRENLDRNILQDGKKAVSLVNNMGESTQRDLNSSGNIHTDRNEPCVTAPQNSKVWNSALLFFFVVFRSFISTNVL